MPIGKKSAGDNTLYALIAFVALFIITTTLAVICYLKFEEQRGLADAAQKKLNDIASAAEVQKVGTLVGAEQPSKSRLKVMLDYLDRAVSLIVPGEPGDTSAEVKINGAAAKVKEAVAAIGERNPELNDLDPNAALLQITDKLSTTLQNTRSAEEASKEQLATLQNRFDDATKAGLEKEQTLLAEKDKFQQQFEKARGDYDELKTLLEKKTEEQVKDLYEKLDQEKATRDEINKQLLKSRAELQAAHDRIQRILKEGVLPPPDAEAKVFEPDGKVLLIDDQAKIVHINLGSDDHVYVGLTFSVYDKSQPIPRSGKGKAEIEVYKVDKNISVARIIRAESKNPIGVDDVVANLVWDANKTNVFVVTGDFDLNGDGVIDADGVEKIRKLIEKWGGKVDDTVTVNTDFVVLGTPPEVPQKPTLAETEVSPNAMERYDRAVERLANYKQVQSRAEALSIPILNADRFLYFIGYKTQAGKPGAF
ncbi:MAG: hypothetical protein ABSG82_08600 [Sedimentisphaerales bacterium]|jgi:hypothetical protein